MHGLIAQGVASAVTNLGVQDPPAAGPAPARTPSGLPLRQPAADEFLHAVGPFRLRGGLRAGRRAGPPGPRRGAGPRRGRRGLLPGPHRRPLALGCAVRFRDRRRRGHGDAEVVARPAAVPRRPAAAPSRPRNFPDGQGLGIAVNTLGGSYADETVDALQKVFPKAYIKEIGPDETVDGGDRRGSPTRPGIAALGVWGGDGTVGAAAAAAVEHSLPLLVLPGGTLNHFARDAGTPTLDGRRAGGVARRGGRGRRRPRGRGARAPRQPGAAAN